MSMDLITLFIYSSELAGLLEGSPLQKIFQSGEGEFLFRFRMPGKNYFLFISLEPGQERIHPVPHKFTSEVLPSPFCMSIRKHLEGGRVRDISLFGNDRIVKVKFTRGEEEKYLVFEFIERSSNIFILDNEYRYITAYTRRDLNRKITAGQKYELPPAPSGKNPITTGIDDVIHIVKSEESRKIKVRQLLKNSFFGMTDDYLGEIIERASLNPDVAAETLSEKEVQDLGLAWGEYITRIKNLDIDPVICYKKNDPDMEGRPFKFTPWRFETDKDLPCEKLTSLGDALQAYFFERTESRSLDELKKNLESAVKKHTRKVKRRIEKQEQDLEGTKKAESYKKWGDLLVAQGRAYPEKMDKIEVDDYYQDPPQRISIPLDPSKTISDNAQEFYKKFKKAKRGQEIVKERLQLSLDELSYLDELLYEIESAEQPEDLEDVASNLEAEGIYRMPGKRGKKGEESTGPRKYVLDGGYVALVGRNSKQNEEISVKIARKDDLWFHARQIPGSHVLVRVQKPSIPVPDKVIHKAAQLAAFFSKAKNSSKVPVDYTPIKNVRKVKGQKTGQVFYTNEKTIMVKPEQPGSGEL
jgi:predicted ribosome quality control (RQC) complex YloA/Tae2 family protein